MQGNRARTCSWPRKPERRWKTSFEGAGGGLETEDIIQPRQKDRQKEGKKERKKERKEFPVERGR